MNVEIMDEKEFEQFIDWAEKQASNLEITVDYFMEEFYEVDN